MTVKKLRWTIRLGLTALLLGAALCAGAAADPLPAALLAADALVRTRPAEAIDVLERYANDTGAATLPVRRALLVRLRRTRLDLGDYAAARAVSASLRELGRQHNDPASLAWAEMTDIEEQLRDFRPDAAKAGLERVERQVSPATLPDLAFAVHMAYGRLYLLKAEYEHAIEQFQAGVEMAPRTEGPASARVEALRNLAYTYLSLHDNTRADLMVRKALESDDGTLRAYIRSLLHLGHAIVLLDEKRLSDAEAAFALALDIARSSGVRVVESRILGDWAELALQRNNFVGAERLSRQALQVAEAIGDSGVALTARANIGFALGEQGKVAEALPYIDAVVERFRQQSNSQSLLAVLDEKGHMLERQGLFKETVSVLREQQALERKQFTEQRGKAVAALQQRFETDQNRRRIELLEKQNKLKDAEIRNRELRQVTMGLAVLLTVAVGALMALLYRRARRSNAQLQALNSRLAEHAVRDPLTGLYNRRSFVEMMETRARRIDGERRSGDSALGDTFMVLDLDHFKTVNDTHGHAAGDAVLVEVARRLQAAVRDSDTVLRWGGEEFVIWLPGCGAAQSAMLAQRVLDTVGGTPMQVGIETLRVTVSMGMIDMPFAGLPRAEFEWQRALQLADAALYLAKNAGRNRCYQLLPASAPLRISLAELERDLGGAVAAGHVALHTIMPQAPPVADFADIAGADIPSPS
jgi:diguanylate cyclase (GGDEF)-like protein